MNKGEIKEVIEMDEEGNEVVVKMQVVEIKENVVIYKILN